MSYQLGKCCLYINIGKSQVVLEGMNKKERKGIEKLNASITDPVGIEAIKLFVSKLNEMDQEDFTVEEAKELLHSLLDELEAGPGKVFMPLRAVITGQSRGADLFNVLYIIGKTRTLDRINTMVEKYNIY